MKTEKLSKAEYRDYIKSPAWQETRKRFWKSKLPKYCYCCEISDVPLDLHHRTYKSLGKENLSHLVLVCRDCHNRIHETQKTEDINLWAATKLIRNRIRRRERKRQRKLSKKTRSSRIRVFNPVSSSWENLDP